MWGVILFVCFLHINYILCASPTRQSQGSGSCFQALRLGPVSVGRTEPSGAGPQGATRGSLPSCSQASRPIAPFRGVMKTGKCVTFGGGGIRNIFNNCYRLMCFSFMCLIMIFCVFRAGLLRLAVIYVLGQIIRRCRGLFCASQAV